jgi:hypothetical protein
MKKFQNNLSSLADLAESKTGTYQEVLDLMQTNFGSDNADMKTS